MDAQRLDSPKTLLFDIIQATVLCRLHGTDLVTLHTTCPPSIQSGNPTLLLEFEVTKGDAKAYLMDKLEIPEEMIEIIDPDYAKLEFGNAEFARKRPASSVNDYSIDDALGGDWIDKE